MEGAHHTDLKQYAENGDVEKVKLALAAGTDVHAWDDAALRKSAENGHADGDHALYISAANGHTEVVRLNFHSHSSLFSLVISYFLC
jgi:hypothetical protein